MVDLAQGSGAAGGALNWYAIAQYVTLALVSIFGFLGRQMWNDVRDVKEKVAVLWDRSNRDDDRTGRADRHDDAPPAAA